jgi:hypothetical protein
MEAKSKSKVRRMKDEPIPSHPSSVSLPPLVHPLGSAIVANDVDALIDAYGRCKTLAGDLAAFLERVSAALAVGVDFGGAKSARVRGTRRRALLTLPDSNWEQAALKQLWADFPSIRDAFLRVASVSPKLKELHSGDVQPPALARLKILVEAAEKPSTRPPRVTIEE